MIRIAIRRNNLDGGEWLRDGCTPSASSRTKTHLALKTETRVLPILSTELVPTSVMQSVRRIGGN